jgi:hypothetical protein
MKALTICQPYAELIMLGEKRVENRTWSTPYRGPLAIHAGRSRRWLDTYRPLPARMDFGAIVGICDLTQLVPIERIRDGRPLPKSLAWLHDHEHVEGPWCWVLEHVRRFERPIFCGGRQGLWDFDDAAGEMEYGMSTLMPAGPPAHRCHVCGCTEHAPCAEGCWWIEPDLCSACEDSPLATMTRDEEKRSKSTTQSRRKNAC